MKEVYCTPVKQYGMLAEYFNMFVSVPPQNQNLWSSVGVMQSNSTRTEGMYISYFDTMPNDAEVAFVDSEFLD